MIKVTIQSFFHEDTNTISYLVSDPLTGKAAVIDPVADYEPSDGKLGFTSVNLILDAARKENLDVIWVLETHIHADHLSAAHYIRTKTGAQVGIGDKIDKVQGIFNPLFNYKKSDNSEKDFDHQFYDGEVIKLGNLDVRVIHTPGHTPACVTYCIGDAAFVGDTLFMPDYGTARADFPGGDALTLYQSIQRILELPAETRLFMCHDYKPATRDRYVWETTVKAQRDSNVHVHQGVSADEFVQMRQGRDATLSSPKLILPSIQFNLRAGRLPEPESNNRRYLKIPLTIDDATE